MLPNIDLTSLHGAPLDRRAARKSLQGGNMAHDPTWPRTEERPRARSASGSIACIVFVGAMGAAFWFGAIWASQTWITLPAFMR